MSGRQIQWMRRFQQAFAALFVGLAVMLALPSAGLAASEPIGLRQQPPLPSTGGLTPEQREAFLQSIGQQILQGSVQGGGRDLLEALVGQVQQCLAIELEKGKSLAEAGEACADLVQEAISPGSGMNPISPDDQRWLAQSDAGLRNRGKAQGWSEKDINNASLLTTGCIARFLKAGAPREEGPRSARGHS
jgi:hypothetical protein